MTQLPSLSRRQFAQLVQVAPSTVTAWMQQGMPHRNGGRQGRSVEIRLADAMPWLVKFKHSQQDSQRERLAKEQADRVALANAVTRGDHMLRSQVEPFLLGMLADFAAGLEAIPDRLAGELVGVSDQATIRQRLLVEVRSVRAGFAESIRKLASRAVDAGEGRAQ